MQRAVLIPHLDDGLAGRKTPIHLMEPWIALHGKRAAIGCDSCEAHAPSRASVSETARSDVLASLRLS